MIIIDSALERREQQRDPIRVAMIGAGFMARGVALQIAQHVPGMELVAICNRSIEGARRAYLEAGVENVVTVDSASALEKALANRRCAVTDNPAAVCRAGQVDAVLEVTGTIDYAAAAILDAIAQGKHVIAMNAELDATLGPLLKHRADQAGVVFTNTDGDQPGVIMNLYRYVRGLGAKPVLCGNIKGLQDPYRNPTTQAEFARRWKQQPYMVTSFADGSKISFEQAVVANATGMRVARRGMLGPTVETGTPVQEAADWYPHEALLEGAGIVDYVVGAAPAPGVFVLGTQEHPAQRHYLAYYKMGDGPFYCFFTPYHLCHLEVPTTIARAVLFQDAAVAPAGGPCVEVVATAKRDLKAGETLDGIGYYMTYGQAENAAVCARERLLPMGLAEGTRMRRSLARDTVLTTDDVEVPEGRLCDRLRREQAQLFQGV